MFLLNEEIFRRVETDLIDKEFKKIIQGLKDENPKDYKNIDLNSKFSVELRNIEKAVFKLMNSKIILKFDDASNYRRISYGMMIFPSMQEIHGKIVDAIERQKEGFYLRECSNVLIVIDIALLTLIKKFDLNERHLTAILLHELGHKVYVRSQANIIGKSKGEILMLSIFGTVFSVPLAILNVALPFIFLFGVYQIMIVKNIKAYVDSEHLSDLTSVKYGYGKETFEIMNIFYSMDKNKRFKRIKLLNALLNSLNTSKMRRDKVRNALKKELSDSKNSKEEKNLIKKTLEEINKIGE